jgi:predicted ribonuclease YlaK|tara:strand:- start:520 stop:1212 length:693 start_codon:yes stop_codon:yes gene_type:complete
MANLEINLSDMVDVKPIGDNQKEVFDSYKKGLNQFVFGAAGTGKTFVLLYNALKEVLDPKTKADKVIIVRSFTPTRESASDANDIKSFETTYKNMVQYMFKQPNDEAFSLLFNKLKQQGSIQFASTSFLRGLTFDRAIIIVDECQNMNFHELDTITTRVGTDTKINFAGDFFQSDLIETNERNGLHDFMRVLENMKSFVTTEFTIGDIVRGGLVREYLVEKTKLGLGVEV